MFLKLLLILGGAVLFSFAVMMVVAIIVGVFSAIKEEKELKELRNNPDPPVFLGFDVYDKDGRLVESMRTPESRKIWRD